jgi:membrane associated rhomboid family serine protease
MVAFVPTRHSPITHWLIAITLVTSVVVAIDAQSGGMLFVWLALVPDRVWDGEVWRLATWPFVHVSPFALIFSCVALYWFGGGLLGTWGRDRFVRFLGATILIAGVGTSLVSLIAPDTGWIPHWGGMIVVDVLVIAWALQFPDRRLIVYWVLVVGGPTLAYGTLAVTALIALYAGVAWTLPELIACIVALLYMNKTHVRWLLMLRAYLARRRLGVIDGDRHGGPYGPD